MKIFKLMNICAMFGFTLCLGLVSCSDDDGVPADIEDVSTVPGEPGYVQPSGVRVFKEQIILRCEGLIEDCLITAIVPYQYTYKEYPNKLKYGSVTVSSANPLPVVPPDEYYKVRRMEDTEPKFLRLETSDVYWDSKQDFEIEANNGKGNKEMVTMRRFFRDFKMVTDVTGADWELTLKFMLPIKVKTETSLVTDEIQYTQGELNEMMSYIESPEDEWILDIDLTDFKIPKSTLKLSLLIQILDNIYVFEGPTKYFEYDSTVTP